MCISMYMYVYVCIYVYISKEEVETITHSRKSLFFNKTSVWIKREGDPDFDSFDGT